MHSARVKASTNVNYTHITLALERERQEGLWGLLDNQASQDGAFQVQQETV